jgi:hypothetical protein
MSADRGSCFVHRETKQREPARFETSKRRPASPSPKPVFAWLKFGWILCDLVGLLQPRHGTKLEVRCKGGR